MGLRHDLRNLITALEDVHDRIPFGSVYLSEDEVPSEVNALPHGLIGENVEAGPIINSAVRSR